MPSAPRILFYSHPSTSEPADLTFLTEAGYDVTTVSEQAIESWLNTFVEEALLVISHPSAGEGLRLAEDVLQEHPQLPIILVCHECGVTDLQQALRTGLIDLLPLPFDPALLLDSIERGISRQNPWHEWNRLAQTLDGLIDGVILVDQHCQVQLINPSAKQIFSLTDEKVEGKPVGEVINNPDMLDLFTNQNPFPHRGEISLEGGRIYGAQASLLPNIGIAVVLQEITHLKELDRIKTDFVNTVSHDLRSPLTAIYGFVGLIDRVGPVNKQQEEFIRHIQSNVQHITALINDLLELGRVEADYDIQMEDINLKDIIIESIKSVDYQLNTKMQQLNLELPADIPLILGNRVHLQRMVINLIDNAIKFTPPLGEISLKCKVETHQLILEVSDTGHGIPLEEQPLVFNKFYRGTNLSADTPGTGLGLSIVKTVIEKHHGRIWLESSPQGTTFTVILPLK